MTFAMILRVFGIPTLVCPLLHFKMHEKNLQLLCRIFDHSIALTFPRLQHNTHYTNELEAKQ